jgi:ATP-dependent DNA helicase RecG
LCKKLAKIGLHSEADLLVHLPLRYEDETRVTPVARAPWGEPVQVEVVVQSNEIQLSPAPADGGAGGRTKVVN